MIDWVATGQVIRKSGILWRMNEKSRNCTCDDWVNNIERLLMSVYLWAHGIVYDGVRIRYCPWCGAKLDELEVGCKKILQQR